MSKRILITTTSFLDTPGAHHTQLARSGLECITARGPLSQAELLEQIKQHGPFIGVICGEDEMSSEVIDALAPDVKVISKYGVGIDKIDGAAAKKHGMIVSNTPGSNHTTVTELAFGLLIGLVRHIPEENSLVHKAQWKRITGRELAGKTIGVLGVGRVGREMCTRALAFGMNVLAFNSSWSSVHEQFIADARTMVGLASFSNPVRTIEHHRTIETVLLNSDIISLHMNLTKENRGFLNRSRLNQCKRGVIIINVSRAGLVDGEALVECLRNGQVGGYGADVLEPEPVTPGNPLLGVPNVLLTPHIGSRTLESIERQGLMAVENLLKALD